MAGTKEWYEFEKAYVEETFGDILCDSCKHHLERNICKAFPNGIPLGIVSGRIDHRKPVPGDNGIQYESKVFSVSEEALAVGLSPTVAAETALCFICEHLNDPNLSCPAYPDGIPMDILKGMRCHTKVFKDQAGQTVYKRVRMER
jgi:hypothetical protein